MDIHPAHIRLAVALHHAQKFPTVSLVKTCMVRNQINRGDPLGFHIIHNDSKQLPRNAFAAAGFFRIYRSDVGGKVLSVVKVVFNNAHAANDFVAIQAKIPTVFCFSA